MNKNPGFQVHHRVKGVAQVSLTVHATRADALKRAAAFRKITGLADVWVERTP